MKEFILKIKKIISIFENLKTLDPDDYAKNGYDKAMMELVIKAAEQWLEKFQPLINTISKDGSDQDINWQLWYAEWESEEAERDLQFLRWIKQNYDWQDAQNAPEDAPRSDTRFEDFWEDELNRYWVRA